MPAWQGRHWSDPNGLREQVWRHSLACYLRMVCRRCKVCRWLWRQDGYRVLCLCPNCHCRDAGHPDHRGPLAVCVWVCGCQRREPDPNVGHWRLEFPPSILFPHPSIHPSHRGPQRQWLGHLGLHAQSARSGEYNFQAHLADRNYRQSARLECPNLGLPRRLPPRL